MNEPPVRNPVLEAQRQRRYLIIGVRVIFLLLLTSVSFLQVYAQKVVPQGVADWVPWTAPLSIAVVVFSLALVVDLATPNKKIATISGVFIGLIMGLVATFALTFLVDLLVETWIGDKQTLEAFKPYANMLRLMLGVALCYLGVTTVLQTQDDFRLVVPYVEFAKQIRGVKPTILDTSALIDARVVDIAAGGLIQSTLIIPKFVIAELQMLADSSDRLKRSRGRRGLEVVTRLQRLGTVGVSIDDTPVPDSSVDQKLVELAQLLSGRILTTDLGLARVGQIHGVTVLNLHELANAFKPALIPGENLSLRLVKPGEQPGQAVGYLEDGTMVVAEGGAPHIGREARLLVTSTLQTTAGRLIFARLSDTEASSPDAASASPAPAALSDAARDANPAPNDSAARESVQSPVHGPAGEGSGQRPASSPAPGEAVAPTPGKHGQRRPGWPRNPRR